MADVIQLLSDHIANQIAAGEVIQRPASAVKELMENAIDAGATEIQLIIKDAGKELVQVIDNGKGMSPTDARMSFERHATSKIKNIQDLFTIRTMGFRGEALASIAAVTQVELKTKQQDAEMGTRIVIEGTEVKLQEPCSTTTGTNIMVKNLFFNVPARRNFLKSNTAEYRHILDEFSRIALSYPAIKFRLWNNNTEHFHLESGNLKTRIVELLGNNYEKKLIPVEEKTDLLHIKGFIGKPETATKTRGNQFFFINNRFIRNAYLNHAVANAFDNLIEKETFPFYVLFLEVDPSRVDVNVHPTKQEVKFEDDRMMYAYLNAAIKHALARNNIAPSLDFTLSPEIMKLPSVQRISGEQEREATQKGYLYNVFTGSGQAHIIERKDSLKQWKALYEIAENTKTPTTEEHFLPHKQSEILPITKAESFKPTEQKINSMLWIQGAYLATTLKSGMIIIDMQRAQQRIIYDRLVEQYEAQSIPSQKLLFPATYEFSAQDFLILETALEDLSRAGFDVVPFGKNTFAIQGVPSGLPTQEERDFLEDVIDQIRHESTDAINKRFEQMLMQLAWRMSRNTGNMQQPENQQALIDELFACPQPEYTPDGKKVFKILKREELEGMME